MRGLNVGATPSWCGGGVERRARLEAGGWLAWPGARVDGYSAHLALVICAFSEQ